MGGLLKIATVVKRDRPLRDLCLVIAIEDHAGRRVAAFTPQFQAAELLMDQVNSGTITCEIPRLRLLPGLYYVTLLVKRGQYMMSKDLDRIERAGFDVFSRRMRLSDRERLCLAIGCWLKHLLRLS
jgi:hypothetical protein